MKTRQIFIIVLGAVLLGSAGCQAVAYTAHKDIVVSCIENGGSWVEGSLDDEPSESTSGSSIRVKLGTSYTGDRCVAVSAVYEEGEF